MSWEQIMTLYLPISNTYIVQFPCRQLTTTQYLKISFKFDKNLNTIKTVHSTSNFNGNAKSVSKRSKILPHTTDKFALIELALLTSLYYLKSNIE